MVVVVMVVVAADAAAIGAARYRCFRLWKSRKWERAFLWGIDVMGVCV